MLKLWRSVLVDFGRIAIIVPIPGRPDGKEIRFLDDIPDRDVQGRRGCPSRPPAAENSELAQSAFLTPTSTLVSCYPLDDDRRGQMISRRSTTYRRFASAARRRGIKGPAVFLLPAGILEVDPQLLKLCALLTHVEP